MRFPGPAPGIPLEQQPEGVVLRCLLCGEARGEQDAGGTLEAVAMLAILWVLDARHARERWARMSLKEIALQPWQFSCFNANDPNRARLLDLWKDDPTSWERADTICDLFERGLTLPPVRRATHYCTKALWGRAPKNPGTPQWFEAPEIAAGRTRKVAEWGSHVFAEAA